MEQKYNTSFIPKKFLGDSVGGTSGGTQYVQRRSVMGPGYYFTVLLFVATLIGAGGVFAYTKLTQQNIQVRIDELQDLTLSVDVSEIESFIRLNNRFQSASALLSKHVATSKTLALLERETIQGVRYLTFMYEGSDENLMQFTLHGEARDFKQVALQAKQFEKQDILRTVSVTELGYGDEENQSTVLFDMSISVDPRLVSFGYSQSQAGASTPAATQSTVAPVSEPEPQPTPEQQPPEPAEATSAELPPTLPPAPEAP